MANRVLWIKSLAVVAVAAGLVACGGGSRSAAPFYTSNTTVNATAAAYSGITGTYTFPAGVAEFGTTTTTDVSFSGTAAAPTFTIGSGGASVSGNLSFGSCIFTITNSPYTGSHLLALGRVITIGRCQFTIRTLGRPYVSGPNLYPTVLDLGAGSSNPVDTTFTGNGTGTLTVGNTTTSAATGGTGGGS